MNLSRLLLLVPALLATAARTTAQSDYISMARIEVSHKHTNNVALGTGAYRLELWAVEGSMPGTTGVVVAPPATTGLPNQNLVSSPSPWWSIEGVEFDSGFMGAYEFTFAGPMGALDIALPSYSVPATGSVALVTSPLGGATNVPLSPTFAWLPITGWPAMSGADIGIEVYDITADLDLPWATLPIGAVSWAPPYSLVAGHDYQFQISVGLRLNSNGLSTMSGDQYDLEQSYSESNSIFFRTSSASVGTTYCAAVPNSSGSDGSISASGSAVVTVNNLILRASSLPSHSFGYFLTSQMQGFIMNPGGSAGNLCLGGAIGRYVGPGQIRNSGSAQEISLLLDLTMTPTPTGLIAVQPGQTWNFTAWHRDSVGGTATSNFTDAVAVTFQ